MLSSYSYKLTPLALSDIDEALDYIKNKLCNPKAASDLLNAIIKAIDNACLFPRSNGNCADYMIEDQNIRKVLVDNFVLVYEINDIQKQIYILRFRYSRMELSKLEIK